MKKWSEQLDHYLNLLVKNNNFMGSVTISQNKQFVYQKAFGYMDLSNKMKAEIDTKYRIGSITKMFTAVMVLKFIEENMLTFNTKLSTFYPDIPNANKITIKHLLAHRSGLFDLTDDPWHYKVFTKYRAKDENIRIIKSYEPVIEPGKKSQYCNTGYILLGYIIEDISGKNYNTNLQEQICNKIGLKSTYYGSKICPQKNESIPYIYESGTGWRLAPEPDLSISHGAGAIVSTTGEITRFINALFKNKLVGKESLAEMVKIEDGEGMGVKKLPYTRAGYAHPGTMPGLSSITGFIPDDDVGFTLSANGLYKIEIKELISNILDICFNAGTMLPSWTTPAFRGKRIHYNTLYSNVAESKVSYHFYMPELYEIDHNQRFPVLYWLHGTGGGEAGNNIEWLSNYFDTLIHEGKIPPMLIIFPYGMVDSMWADSKDGNVLMETVLIKNLLPHIDKTFRTIVSPKGRLIEGFSMGGYGAARLAFTYHDIFGAVSILGGGPLQKELTDENTPLSSPGENEALMQKVYGGDIDYFKAMSPYEIVKRNVNALKRKIIIRQIVGENDPVLNNNLDFHTHLLNLKIPHDFKQLPDVIHDSTQYLNALGKDNILFYNLIFGKRT
jgi:D-alanyl-D-alanine carboxypeptidase